MIPRLLAWAGMRELFVWVWRERREGGREEEGGRGEGRREEEEESEGRKGGRGKESNGR